MTIHTLTGNDLARAEGACSLAIAWWKKLGRRSGYQRKEIAALKELSSKLQEIGMHAYPYENHQEAPLDYGDERVMRLDASVVKKTRARAKRARPRF